MQKDNSLFNKIAEICRPKFCGDTTIIINARVKIVKLTGDDAELNGLTGRTTNPFPRCYPTKGMVGIYLDPGQRKVSTEGNRLNIEVENVVIIPTEDDLIAMNLFRQSNK